MGKLYVIHSVIKFYFVMSHNFIGDFSETCPIIVMVPYTNQIKTIIIYTQIYYRLLNNNNKSS